MDGLSIKSVVVDEVRDLPEGVLGEGLPELPEDVLPVVRSLSYDQGQILQDILRLHGRGSKHYDVDLTFSKGSFYKGREWMLPTHRFDIDPNAEGEGVVVADSTNVPLEDSSVGSVVFDPPFLTYVRAGRTGNGSMVMAREFSGYWRYDELAEHYTRTLDEAQRILRRKGILVFKCQDLIHNHRMHCTHFNVIAWAQDRDFRLKDLFVLGANHRLPRPNQRGPQQHARIHHSYFLVLEKI